MMTEEKTTLSQKLSISPLSQGMKVSEFCRRFPIAKETAYRWAREGRIKTLRFGRTVFIPLDEVERIMTEGVSQDAPNTDAA